MKKYSFILWAALAMVSVFTACTNEDSLVIEQTEAKTVTIRATIDGDLGSRVALTDDADNRVVKVDWAEGDDFKIEVNGRNYTFVYNPSTGEFEYDNNQNETFPETFASAGIVTAVYLATTPTEYANQSGTLEGAAAFLTMTATLDVTAGQSTENLALNFKHNNSIVKLTLKNDAFKGNSVTSVALKSGSDAVVTASGDFTGDADGNIVVYFAVAPQDMTDIWIHAVCESSNYITTLTDNTLGIGKLYNVSKTLVRLKTADEAVKGDLAMKDGTFISKDDIDNLTDEQKANVRGIVFWTESEDGNATLTSDAIMTDEYPNCTHGLIVALKNVSESCLWQSGYESVANWQNDEFNADNTSDYKSIASKRNNDDCIKYILGYQNTKVLKAYNESLSSDESGKTVLPVSELATWEDNNPAPANTTGWFIPSVKELHMLCYKDVNDLLTYNTSNTTTRTVIDPLIEALGGKKLSDYYYWSSSEDAAYAYNAFSVYFSYGSVNYYFKGGNTAYVRAVCAF